MNPRKLDVLDVNDPEPAAYLPFDPADLTLWIMERTIAPQVEAHPEMARIGMTPAKAHALGRRAALELYAAGWRTTEGIWHLADNPIPAPQPPNLPPVSPLRLAA